MNRKRSLVPDVYKQRKKLCLSNTNNNEGESSEENIEGQCRPVSHDAPGNNPVSQYLEPSLMPFPNIKLYSLPNLAFTVPSFHFPLGNVPSDTKAALLFLRTLFPVEKFEGRLPAIIVKHQLYSLVKNKTDVDKHLGELRTKNEVRLFKLGTDPDDFTIVFSSDYQMHVRKVCTEWGTQKPLLDKFLEFLCHCPDISLTKDTLRKENFSDEEIRELITVGLLTVRDVGSWWVAIPSAGQFMKTFIRGRKSMLLMIRKAKYKEILQKELESRKLPKTAKLGMQYHIHDIIGAELVTCIDTTSGRLLRLKE